MPLIHHTLFPLGIKKTESIDMMSAMSECILTIITPALLSLFHDENPTTMWKIKAIRIRRGLPSESSLRTILFLLLFQNGRKVVSFVSTVPQFSKFLRIQGLSR